jgi:hypothetical protein
MQANGNQFDYTLNNYFMTYYLDNICFPKDKYVLVCRNEAIQMQMPKIKFELPDDNELKLDSKQYFLYPRVTNETDVKYL